jgi:hypothetical protein
MTIQSFELWLYDSLGGRLRLMDTTTGFSYVKTANKAGSWRINLPGTFGTEQLVKDNMIAIYRRTAAGALRLEQAGFLRGIDLFDDTSGSAQISIYGPDFNSLLTGRIVAYDAGSDEAAKSDFADDMIKEVVRENLGSSATDTDRDWSGNGFSVEVDFGLGASIDKRFSRDNVLEVCAAIAEASTQNGTRVYFHCVPEFQRDSVNIQLRTFIGQIGQDRTAGTSEQLVFAPEYGNLSSPRLTTDWRKEKSVIYVGGQGLLSDRTVVEVSDTTLISSSPWGRRERFVNAVNDKSTNELTARGEESLEKHRALRKFSGNLMSVPGSFYGIDWEWGDRVTISYQDVQLNVNVDKVQVSVAQDGTETVTARQEVVS